MRAHVMNGDLIANTIEVESLDFMPGLIDASIGGGPGDSIVDGVLVPKPADPIPVPQSVTMRQARLALLGAGMLDAVNTAVTAMTGSAGIAARIEWEYSGEVQRNKELTLGLGAALGLTSAQLDSLFITASTIP